MTPQDLEVDEETLTANKDIQDIKKALKDINEDSKEEDFIDKKEEIKAKKAALRAKEEELRAELIVSKMAEYVKTVDCEPLVLEEYEYAMSMAERDHQFDDEKGVAYQEDEELLYPDLHVPQGDFLENFNMNNDSLLNHFV